MRYFLFALLLFSQSALADGITVTINGVGETWTFSPDDQAKLDDWVHTAYKCHTNVPTSAMLPPSNCPINVSHQEAEATLAQATLQGILDSMVQFQKRRNALVYPASSRVEPMKLMPLVPATKNKINPK